MYFPQNPQMSAAKPLSFLFNIQEIKKVENAANAGRIQQASWQKVIIHNLHLVSSQYATLILAAAEFQTKSKSPKPGGFLLFLDRS